MTLALMQGRLLIIEIRVGIRAETAASLFRWNYVDFLVEELV